MLRSILFLILAVSFIFCSLEGADKAPTAPGKLIFAPIPKLPENWWKDPDSVWKTWDQKSYYLWGANLRNFKIFNPEKLLKGSGMASVKHGPTRGRGHPHYIGVITTSLSFMQNELVFRFLEEKLKSGFNIVVPVINGRYSLGTGVAFRRHASKKNWYRSQKYLFEQLLYLSQIAEEIVITEKTFWPDCTLSMSSDSSVMLPIRGEQDIKKILPYLEWKIN